MMKTRDKASLAIFLAVITLVAVVAGTVFAVGQAKCWWGHEYDKDGICTKCGAEKPVDSEKEEQKIEENNEQLAFASTGRGLIIRKKAVTSSNAQSVTLTATTEPAGQQNVVLDWSIAWKNASSTWATGKKVSDYVTMTASGMEAQLKCLQAFGEQIIVKVVSVDNPDASATCTLDYRKRATVTVTMKCSDGTSVTLDESYVSSNGSKLATIIAGKAYTPSVNIVEGVGTVGSYTVSESYGDFVDDFETVIGYTRPSKYDSSDISFGRRFGSGESKIDNSLLFNLNKITNWANYSDYVYEEEEQDDISASVIAKIANKGTGAHLGQWHVQLKNEKGAVAATMTFYFAIDVTSIRVTNISLSSGSIEF